MTKKFWVSLALLRQCNFEIEVEAKNEKEAAKEAARIWEEEDYNYQSGDVVSFDGAETRIDYDIENDQGVYVEEANQ